MTRSREWVTCRQYSILIFQYKSLVHLKCYILIQIPSHSDIYFQRHEYSLKLICHLFKPVSQISVPNIRLIPLDHVTYIYCIINFSQSPPPVTGVPPSLPRPNSNQGYHVLNPEGQDSGGTFSIGTDRAPTSDGEIYDDIDQDGE